MIENDDLRTGGSGPEDTVGGLVAGDLGDTDGGFTHGALDAGDPVEETDRTTEPGQGEAGDDEGGSAGQIHGTGSTGRPTGGGDTSGSAH